MAYNPFTVLPITACDPYTLPVFPACQVTTTYDQKRSQIGGLFVIPTGADKPTDWGTADDWTDVIDNSVTDGTKGHYLVGRGSFLPLSAVEVNLAGGRVQKVSERLYRFAFTVVNLNDGHADFVRRIQNGQANFDFWLQTIDSRIIGGATGMRPFLVNADILFTEGKDDREAATFIFDTWLWNFPDMTALAVDMSAIGGGNPLGCGCDVQGEVSDFPSYIDDADAISNGLTSGQLYWVLPGNDAIPAGVLKKIT